MPREIERDEAGAQLRCTLFPHFRMGALRQLRARCTRARTMPAILQRMQSLLLHGSHDLRGGIPPRINSTVTTKEIGRDSELPPKGWIGVQLLGVSSQGGFFVPGRACDHAMHRKTSRPANFAVIPPHQHLQFWGEYRQGSKEGEVIVIDEEITVTKGRPLVKNQCAEKSSTTLRGASLPKKL